MRDANDTRAGAGVTRGSAPADASHAARPEDLANLLLQRLNAGDVDGVVAMYEPDAVLAPPGGGTATGSGGIRQAYTAEVARRQPDGTWRWVLDQPDVTSRPDVAG